MADATNRAVVPRRDRLNFISVQMTAGGDELRSDVLKKVGSCDARGREQLSDDE